MESIGKRASMHVLARVLAAASGKRLNLCIIVDFKFNTAATLSLSLSLPLSHATNNSPRWWILIGSLIDIPSSSAARGILFSIFHLLRPASVAQGVSCFARRPSGNKRFPVEEARGREWFFHAGQPARFAFSSSFNVLTCSPLNIETPMRSAFTSLFREISLNLIRRNFPESKIQRRAEREREREREFKGQILRRKTRGGINTPNSTKIH